jgi:single-strand DNA-binding protein
VNARDNTPLRTLIADRLAAGEDTAAGIAQAIGKGDTPSIVVKELNAMRTDGQVECEQRGKKKELVYWLAEPLEVAAGNVAPESPDDRAPTTISDSVLPAGMRQGTRAAQIYRVLPLYGAKPMTARQIAKATGATIGLISPTLSGMVKAGQISRVLADPCDAYGYTRLPPAGGDIDIQNAQPEVAKNTGSSASGSLSPSEGAAVQSKPAPVAAANDALKKIVDLQNKICMQDADLFKQSGAVVELRNLLAEERAVRMALQEQLEAMQREAMRGASLMSGQDRYTATGYLVRASKRKPRTLLDKDKARDAALSSIRAGRTAGGSLRAGAGRSRPPRRGVEAGMIRPELRRIAAQVRARLQSGKALTWRDVWAMAPDASRTMGARHAAQALPERRDPRRRLDAQHARPRDAGLLLGSGRGCAAPGQHDQRREVRALARRPPGKGRARPQARCIQAPPQPHPRPHHRRHARLHPTRHWMGQEERRINHSGSNAMILTGLARIGKDAELRYTSNNEPVCNISLAYNYGRKGDDGKRPTQWIEAALWGKRAESLAPHLLKGKQVDVALEEPHIETFDGKNGAGHKFVGRVLSIEFASDGQRQDAPQHETRAPAPRPAAAPARPQQSGGAQGGFGDFDDDIPFMRHGHGAAWRAM